MKRLMPWAALLSALFLSSTAFALPMYAQRSGRTCGNCHISPTFEDKNGWPNPDLAERKCNMSCMTCHINPTGGGLRNTSGRYYGQSTLAMMPLQERSYSDYHREVISSGVIRSFRDAFATPAQTTTSTRVAAGRTVPSTWQDVQDGMGAGQIGGRTNWGKPLLSSTEYSLWDGRYGDLNADPLFAMGGDARFAFWSGSKTFFPMQVDLHAVLHPTEHLSLMATAAVRGKVAGPAAVFGQNQFPIFARNAFIMAHELPYMAYAKAGIFMPSFGLYLDDHTGFTRRWFEQDTSTSDDTVIGVEVGLAPNYPYANLSFFKNMRPGYLPEDMNVNAGWGMAANMGWRDMGWSLGAHGMVKRRDLAARGDLDAAGITWGFNPAYFSDKIPLTYMGEFSFGRRPRIGTGEMAAYYASYHELWWLIFNGFSARFKYDVGDSDAQIAGGFEHRFMLGADFTPIPGFTVSPQFRFRLPEEGDPHPDLFVQFHMWF